MRSLVAIAFFSLMLISCGGKGEKKESKENVTTETGGTDITKNPDYQKGIDLIGQNDCLTCHRVDEPHNGPSYRDVANKYANDPDTIISHLAGKIINGGKGVWGEVYMTPHAGLSQADAEAMVKYILLLKK
jgi:cytochrome c